MTQHTATSTGELVVGCQHGKRTAQAAFYRKYRHEVARAVFKVLGPDADLEDVVQDVFIEVFRSISKFKGQSRITTWLYRVCINVALQKIRRRRRRPEGHVCEREDLPCSETPLRSLERKNDTRVVYEILETIAPKKRMVFILHEILGMNSKEISHIVDANILTVRTRLHYARKEFYQKVLDTNLFTGGES